MLPEFPPYSLRQVIALTLQSAIASLDSMPTLDSIQVGRQPGGSGIVYKSAIAFQLSSLCHQNLTDLAIQLMERLPDNSPHFSIGLIPPAWIYFDWSDSAVANWLESCLNWREFKLSYLSYQFKKGTPQVADTKRRKDVESGRSQNDGIKFLEVANRSQKYELFPLQYTHARCCSLLRLAAARGWIQVDSHGAGNFLFSQPVPWFDTRGIWYLTAPYEAKAIASLVDLADNLLSESCVSASNCLKLATILAEAFWGLESSLTLFNGLYDLNSQLLLARLALVALVKNSLRLTLEELYETTALIEI